MVFRHISRFGKKRVRKEAKPLSETEEAQSPISQAEIVFSLIRNRVDVRRYLPDDVDAEVLEFLLEAARHAPSSGNHQPWEFVVVRNNDTKKQLVEAAYNQEWMLQAPVFIVACVNNRLAGAVYGDRGLKLYGTQNVAAAVENMVLMARALGLGTAWVSAFSEIKASLILQLPEYVRPQIIITLGYPAEEPKPPVLQSIEEFTHLEKFGETIRLKNVIKEKKPYYIKFK